MNALVSRIIMISVVWSGVGVLHVHVHRDTECTKMLRNKQGVPTELFIKSQGDHCGPTGWCLLQHGHMDPLCQRRRLAVRGQPLLPMVRPTVRQGARLPQSSSSSVCPSG